MRNFFSFLIALAMIVSMAGAQDSPHSLGPAPTQNVGSHSETGYFDAAIGTRAFTQLSTTPTFQIGKLFMETCVPTNIGAAFPITFPGGLMYRNGTLYTWNQASPFQLWSVDTVTGTHTLVFNMTGVPQANFTGMCWDGTTVYGMSSSLAASQIFSVNMTTGVCTPIGTPSAVCAGGITLMGRMGANYSLFAIDIVADNLYKWNKTTGVATLVGPLGADCNFGQDGGVDPNDNTFYGMVYAGGPQLRKVDTTTGTLGPILCTYSAQATGIAMVQAGGGGGGGIQLALCRTGLNIPLLDHTTIRDSVQFISSNACIVSDVNLRVDNLIHTWDADVRIYLRKGSVGVLAVNWVGGSGDNFINTVLNDSGTTPIASGTAPFTGTFIPSNPLTPFNTTTAAGYWTIVCTDTVTADTGVLNAWCAVITYINCTGVSETVELPNYYSLSQNSPTPFNPSTTIKFGVPKSENVKLVIYDLLGREVKTLVNELRTPGTYEVNFDASSLSSGVYFYKLITPSFTETKRMLLVK
jgi:subtilisin-like proprotein convertase family protein